MPAGEQGQRLPGPGFDEREPVVEQEPVERLAEQHRVVELPAPEGGVERFVVEEAAAA